MIDSVIFDLDGTLWDSSEQLYQYWRQSFPNLSPARIKAAMGKTLPEMSDFWGIPIDQLHLVQQGENLYLRRNPGIPYVGLTNTIKKLKKLGLRLFIASNCQAGYIETFLLANDLGQLFDSYICYEDTRQPKEFNVQHIIRYYGLNPVIVGDGMVDLIAAQYNMIPFVWAQYGFDDRLEDNPYTQMGIKHLRELPTLIEQRFRREPYVS